MVKEGYKQTEIGVIPEDWEVAQVRTVLESYYTGGNYKNSDSTSPYPIIKMGNIQRGRINVRKIEYINDTIPNERDRLQYGDVLFNTRNTPELVGKVGIWKNELPMAYFNSNLLKFVFDKNKANSSFINLILNTPEIIAEMRNIAKGTTSVAAIYPQDLLKVLIKLPPIREQERIAEALSDIDELISSLEKLIAKKKAIKQGTMQQLFREKWASTKLGKLCFLVTKQTGFDYTSHIKPALLKSKAANTLPMIQTINFQGKHFSFDTDYYIPISVASQFPNIILSEKCVLFSIVGASVGNVGLYPGGLAFCGGAIGITRFINPEDAEWVYYFMSCKKGQDQINYVTKGGAQATVTIADIRNFSIPMPTKEERDNFVRILSDIDSDIASSETKLNKLKQVKQGMMQQLLSGKIRLK